MAVADVASLRTVAVQLRALSADPENQPIIAREDGCLRALVSFVQGADRGVAAVAVAAVKNLAAHPDNFELLRAEDALQDALRALLLAGLAAGAPLGDGEDPPDEALRRAVFDVLEELLDEEDDDELDELDELERKAGLTDPDPDDGAAANDDPSLLPAAVTSRLHVPGLSEDVFCMRVEQLIIRRPGVVSVVFEIGAEDAVVYGRVPPEELASFLATMTGTEVTVAEHVESESESEDEDEAAGEAAATAAAGVGAADKENGAPGYLDQTGQRFKDVAKKNAKKKNTISQGATSLAERLEAQRQEESRKKARSNRLMNSIGQGFNKGWGFGW